MSIETTFEVVISILTIAAFYIAGEKNKWGWAIGFLAEICWVVWIVYTQSWGLLLQSAFLMAIFTRNFIKWSKQ